MYSEKVQSFINNYITWWNIIVIDTMAVEYKIPVNKEVTVISFKSNDTDQLYKVLDRAKNCVVIFDRAFFWYESDMGNPYAVANDLFTNLSEYAKKNNLLIFT
jgi:hypothetical protein